MPSLSAISLNCGATRRIRHVAESPMTYSELPRCVRSTLRASRTKFRGIRRCLSEGPSEALQMSTACSSMPDTFGSRVPRYMPVSASTAIRSPGGYECRAGLVGGLKLIRLAHLAKSEHRLMKDEIPSFKRNWGAEAPRDCSCGLVTAGHCLKMRTRPRQQRHCSPPTPRRGRAV